MEPLILIGTLAPLCAVVGIGTLLDPIPRETRWLSRQEDRAMILCLIFSILVPAPLFTWGYLSLVLVPYLGIFLSLLTVVIARTQRPFLIATLSTVLYLIPLFRLAPWDETTIFAIMGAVIYAITILFTIPLYVSVRRKSALALTVS